MATALSSQEPISVEVAAKPSRSGAVDDPRQHDRTAGVIDVRIGAQPFDRRLQLADVAGQQVDEGVGAAGDSAGSDDFGNLLQRTTQRRRSDSALAVELEVSLGGPPQGVLVDDHGETADGSGGLQPVDP